MLPAKLIQQREHHCRVARHPAGYIAGSTRYVRGCHASRRSCLSSRSSHRTTKHSCNDRCITLIHCSMAHQVVKGENQSNDNLRKPWTRQVSCMRISKHRDSCKSSAALDASDGNNDNVIRCFRGQYRLGTRRTHAYKAQNRKLNDSLPIRNQRVARSASVAVLNSTQRYPHHVNRFYAHTSSVDQRWMVLVHLRRFAEPNVTMGDVAGRIAAMAAAESGRGHSSKA